MTTLISTVATFLPLAAPSWQRRFRAPITRFRARRRTDPIMSGGANNYRKGAAIVDRIGKAASG